MPAVFAALLIAELKEESANNLKPDNARGTLINDLPPSEYSCQPEFLGDPQIIIADNDNDAFEKAMFLVERQFPEDCGWTNHDVEISDISGELQIFLNNMLPNGHPFGFYLIGGVGLVRDTSTNNIKQYCVAGACSGINTEHAYRRFKEDILIHQLPNHIAWIGGLTRVTLVPDEQLHTWRTTWMYGYMLQRFDLKEARTH